MLLLKGCVDGIVVLVKRKAAERVVQTRAIVKDAKSVFDCCNKLNLSVKCFPIDSHCIEDFVVLKNAPYMKGIKSAHHLFAFGKKIHVKDDQYSCQLSENPQKSQKDKQVQCFSMSSADLNPDKKVNVNNCVQILCEPYRGCYATITSQSYGDEWEI